MARWARATSVSVPPSPLLSARSKMKTYLQVTTRIKDHRISDNTPITVSRVTMPLCPEAAATASRKA
jgi:hypothetical protein